ncbi:MAG: UTP--glucose-1-phosphate uridylyltransferase [Verrucomicrobia bacterium]|nr:UTP--glucose-1-phosphate uridylyltransferase [Verrucomicrobiota bacterium]
MVTVSQINTIEELALLLKEATLTEEKKALLERFPAVQSWEEFPANLTLEQDFIFKSLVALGQADRLFERPYAGKEMIDLLDLLIPVERFYADIGGLVGYHAHMLRLISSSTSKKETSKYLPPQGIDITEENDFVRRMILEGIRSLPLMAELYPLGGAADRLRLHDERTGRPLPAACLPFLGKTLLENIIADLQSREYLYYKLFHAQVTTPIAIMTSMEKENHAHIVSIFEEHEWFGRSKEYFRLFVQPLVPTLNKQGQWCLQGPAQPLLKPGGHGVIWKLAREEGVFDWLFSLGRKKTLVRQINNPVANTDYGLFAFTGIGCAQDKAFGFASCPRQVRAAEGINILVEKQQEGSYSYALTNIEYCDFKRLGIADQPSKPGSSYSLFPSNTNILFADLSAILTAVEKCPIPGILVNLKKLTYRTENGEKREEEIARLESTMQNIADFFTESLPHRLSPDDAHTLSSYLTYNLRRKTIATAKREFTLGSSLLETPEGCFLEILHNAKELLQRCGFIVPEDADPTMFFHSGPSHIFLYHPALGPLYSIIAQKLRGGRLSSGSELQLGIAEVDIENLDIEGSLRIQADNIMGHFDKNTLTYSERCGRATLKNVRIRNRGIDLEMPNVYWKNEIARLETCQIILRGMSEFYAENVTLSGDHFIEVEDGIRLIAKEVNGEVVFEREAISEPTWHWEYSADSSDHILLQIQK